MTDFTLGAIVGGFGSLALSIGIAFLLKIKSDQSDPFRG